MPEPTTTAIQYRNLGPSGLRVSTLGLGCNNFGRTGTATETQKGADAVIGTAIESGVTFFDGADIYGKQRGLSETLMGHALKGKRDAVVLATKFGMDMEGSNGPDWGARGSRRYIRIAIESSLRRLQTDWIDLYQLHMPDPCTPMEETIATLDDLVAEGKIRYFGHSNLKGWQIAEAEFTAILGRHPRFVSAQNEYSLLARGVETEVLPAVRKYGLGFLPYRPLHNGILTGKYTRDGGPTGSRVSGEKSYLLERTNWVALERFQKFCNDRSVTMLEATFGWLLAQQNLTSVIAGATSPDQVRQNVAAATAWLPEAADLVELDEIFARGASGSA